MTELPLPADIEPPPPGYIYIGTARLGRLNHIRGDLALYTGTGWETDECWAGVSGEYKAIKPESICARRNKLNQFPGGAPVTHDF